MKSIIVVLIIFGAGIGLGQATHEPKTETETVFLTKWKTRVVEKESEVVREQLPASCLEIFTLLDGMEEPVEVLNQTTGEVMDYTGALGKAVFNESINEINRITVRLRLAKDDLGTASIRASEVVQEVQNQHTQCQEDLRNADN